MDATEPGIDASMRSSARRPNARPIGAVAALAVGGGLLVVLAVSPLGFDASSLFEQPVYLAILLGVAAWLGARLGPRATSGGWRRTFSAGLMFGILWPPIAILVVFAAALVDAAGRGVLAASSIPQDVEALVYSVAIFSTYGAIVLVPLGLLWALAARLFARVASRRQWGGVRVERASTAGLVLGLLIIPVVGGAAQTLAYAPWSTRCFALPGGTPSDAAFSPAGDLLVVAIRPDSGSIGTVLLLRWPSGRPLAEWPAVADQAVAVGPDGHVYWSSSDFDHEGTGIVSAIPGFAPTLLVGPDSTGLDDLSWTKAGLFGITTDTQSLATISLASSPSSIVVQPGSQEIGQLWVSTDGSVRATERRAGGAVDISGPTGSMSVPLKGGSLSLALTASQQTIVVAASSGGIRTVDVATGRSRQLLPGSQAFVALSGVGDLAWSNNEGFGRAQLCTSTLGQLGAS